MTKKVQYAVSLNVEGGPTYAFSDVIETSNGYNVISETVKDGQEVDLSTESGDKEGIDLLCISSTKYDDTKKDDDGKITYKLFGNNEIVRKLTRAQVMIGNHSTSYLKDNPTNIVIKNASGEDITVEILILRKAKVEP